MQRYERQNYEDIDISDVNPQTHPICQLKYDGIWCLADSQSNGVSYYSRHGTLKKHDPTVHYQGAFIGELMFGSEWAKEVEGREGKFYVFDLTEDNGRCLKHTPYIERYKRLCEIMDAKLVPPNFELVFNFSTIESLDIWNSVIKEGLYEGLVFRHPNHLWDVTIPRSKYTLTKDLYIVDFEEGKTGKNIGNLGALICTESPMGVGIRHTIGGGLTDKLRNEIWKNPSAFLGRCITVEAFKVFKSGLMRHPQFLHFHQEK